MQKIENLRAEQDTITFLLGEIIFSIKDTENLNLILHKGMYGVDYYRLTYRGVTAFVDKESGDALNKILEEYQPKTKDFIYPTTSEASLELSDSFDNNPYYRLERYELIEGGLRTWYVVVQ